MESGVESSRDLWRGRGVRELVWFGLVWVRVEGGGGERDVLMQWEFGSGRGKRGKEREGGEKGEDEKNGRGEKNGNKRMVGFIRGPSRQGRCGERD